MSNGSTAAADLEGLDLAAMGRELEADEGRQRAAYRDHLGYLTIGVGRLIDARRGGGLSDDEIDLLLHNDIRRKAAELATRWPAFLALLTLEPVRARGILNMAFQLGVDGFLGFHNSVAYLELRQWADAAAHLRQSRWAQQTPARAERVIRMIETGRPR